MNDNGVMDLGYGVTAKWVSWGPFDRAGIREFHTCGSGRCRNPDGTPARCGGSVLFDLPGVSEAFPGREVWQLLSLEPLNLTPSLQCGCPGCPHHGWITNGKWVPAN